mmetsp:Transcript_77878/g.200513  ORF Transcript_77878/g.200513 Transcript_77878/m.200513 type:complete len:237 (+) Transcript_77878:106-816(+)
MVVARISDSRQDSSAVALPTDAAAAPPAAAPLCARSLAALEAASHSIYDKFMSPVQSMRFNWNMLTDDSSDSAASSSAARARGSRPRTLESPSKARSLSRGEVSSTDMSDDSAPFPASPSTSTESDAESEDVFLAVYPVAVLLSLRAAVLRSSPSSSVRYGTRPRADFPEPCESAPTPSAKRAPYRPTLPAASATSWSARAQQQQQQTTTTTEAPKRNGFPPIFGGRRGGWPFGGR